MVYDGVSFSWFLDFLVSARWPLGWVGYRSGPHHVQVNVCQTTDKMMVRFHCGRMVAIFPEGSLPLFPLVKLLSCPACNQLHRLWNDIAFPAVEYEQMDVVRSGHVVEDPQSVALFGFKEPAYPGSAVSPEFEKKFSLVAAVGNVPRVSGQEESFGSGHGLRSPVLKRPF